MSHATEKLVICPYNPAHSILKHRMQNHLFKCRKHHVSDDFERCAFNSTHEVPRLELEYHQNHVCPDRHSFQSEVYTFDEEPRLYPPVRQLDLPEPEEDWDDGQVNEFDPAKNSAEKSLIRGVHGVPPAERKAFKLQHRKHVQEREEEEIAKGPIKSIPRTAEKPKDAPLEPLRQPKELPKGFSFARGKKIQSDEMPKAPGEVPDVAKLSIKSEEENSQTPQGIHAPRMVLMGVGRGKPNGGPAPVPGGASPPTGAWGRGRPQF